ncbi:hypothetical protein FHG87_004976 [Trinorchestia longiramus]|nr:hypothetical protein FHG87_004976 [Trinorchestia longiramus]
MGWTHTDTERERERDRWRYIVDYMSIFSPVSTANRGYLIDSSHVQDMQQQKKQRTRRDLHCSEKTQNHAEFRMYFFHSI